MGCQGRELGRPVQDYARQRVEARRLHAV